MMLLQTSVTLGFVYIFCLFFVDSINIKSSYFTRRDENKVYSHGLIEEVHVKRRLKCILLCDKNKKCNTALYNAISSQCRLYGLTHGKKEQHRGWQCWEDKEPEIKSKVPTESSGSPELFQANSNMTLYQACKEGKLDLVKYILSQGQVDINCRGKNGTTPVMVATESGQVAVFDYLVSQGCDLLSTDDNNNNLLHSACKSGNVQIVKKLTSNGRCVMDNPGLHGWTPVMLSAAMGHKRVFDILVSKGCNLWKRDSYGNNIVHLACTGGNVKMVNYILKQNIFSVDTEGYLKRTPVMAAAKKGHIEVVDFLKSKNCNIRATDENGNNVLHAACAGGNVLMVKHILQLKIFGIESLDYLEKTPVMIAAENGHIGVTELLIKKGCNLKAIDREGDNALHLACYGGYLNIVKYILSLEIVSRECKGKFGFTPLITAARGNHREVVEFLARKGCNVNAVDQIGNNMLIISALCGNSDMVEFVLSRKFLSIESRGYMGNTALLAAAYKGHTETVNLLISKGCNMKAVDNDGNTVLHAACLGGQLDAVKYLITLKRVDRWKKNKNGMTSAQLSRRKGYPEIGSFLDGYQ